MTDDRDAGGASTGPGRGDTWYARRLAERIATLEAENRELGERMAAMLASTSWRVTQPVRRAMDRLRPRRPGPVRRDLGPRGPAQAMPAAETVVDPRSVWVLDSNLFDAAAYRSAAGLGAVSDLAAAEHYVAVGERQGLRPNPHFDPAFYADVHRDVVRTEPSLLLHYARHGRGEGRLALFEPEAHVRPGRKPFDPARRTVLLVCHEATRTGAPILGWNLARQLNRDHNLVVAVLSPEGNLFDLFVDESCFAVGPFVRNQLTWFAMLRFGRHLASRFDFDFALCNSIECQPMLVGLAAMGVPTVTLVHEYPAGAIDVARMQSGMLLSGRVVFDTESQRAAALACWPGITPRTSSVFHQGASAVPADPGRPALTPEALAARRGAVRAAVRGDGTKPVVLGLGTVSMRKGPDLFVATAAAVARKIGPGRVRFVWIGQVPKPHPEGSFIDWLDDQKKRSGLGRDVAFLDAVDDLEGAYEAADAVMISSRLDPFPNVAMDAALAGVPVVCFAGGNGFADYLALDERSRFLSVPFLDVDAAAAALVRLVGDPDLRGRTGDALAERGRRDFSMARYMERLAPVIADAKAIAAQERRDLAVLLADDTFEAALWQNPHEHFTRDEAVWLHVRKAASGQEAAQYCRRPALGFVPQTYADHHPELDAAPFPNPLAHWIGAGKPPGPWSHPVLVAPEAAAAGRGRGGGLRAALHVHLHYPELADDILAGLATNAARLDLFVSTTSEPKAEELRGRFAAYAKGSLRVEACPNRGRDVGPMLTRFAPALQTYDVFGHVHGKRSLALTEVGLSLDLGTRWHSFLTQHLIGDLFPMADLILDRFAASEGLGLVFPEDPNLTGWSLDRDIALGLAARMDPAMRVPRSIDFPIGTMFWARPAALKPLFDLGLGWDDYPEEPVPIDGTVLHALERLLPVVATHAGFDLMTTHVPGVTR